MTWLTKRMSVMSVMAVMSVGNVVVAKALSATEKVVFDASQANLTGITKEITTAIGKSERQVERARASLRDAGLIERIGGTRGHRKVKR